MKRVLVRGAIFCILMTMSFASAISDVRITNVQNKGFTVSWISEEVEEGSVIVAEEGTFYDKRVTAYPSITDKKFKIHYVDINTDPKNSHYGFHIKSGETVSNINYYVRTPDSGGIGGEGIDVSGKVVNTTFVEIFNDDGTSYFAPENIQNVYYEMYIEKPDGKRSAVKSGISGYKSGDQVILEWEALSAPFLNQANTSVFLHDNNDVLVVTFYNYSRGYKEGKTAEGHDYYYNNIGSKRVAELRMPIVEGDRADVTLFENPIPVIDNFDNNPLLVGWQTAGNVSLGLTTNAHYAKALEVNAFNAGEDGYNGYFHYDFSTEFDKSVKEDGSTIFYNIKTNEAYDWGRYKYIKFSVKNVGNGPVDLKLDIKDNDHKDFGFDTTKDDEWVYTINLLKNNGEWKDIYIPLNEILLSRNNSGGDKKFNPLQMIEQKEKDGNKYNSIYPGVPMIGFAVSTGKEGRSGKIIIENIELVKDRNNPYTPGIEKDTDGDGIPDDVEIANGLDPNNPNDASKDPDGDGIDNYNEILNGTNPFIPNGRFPEIDNFEGNTINWTVDGSLVASIENTTDINVSWNYENSLLLEGVSDDYYIGGIQKDILSEVADWDSSYKMLNMLVKSNGQIGDKLVAKLVLKDGSVWAFTQYIGDLDKWTYYGMLLDRFELVSGDNQVQDFSQTQYIRLELISRTATGSVSMYVDNINVSTSDVSYDTDGDGLPDWYEISHDLKINVPNTGDIDGDGWSDLDEYAAETDANQWTPHFPLIDNFERDGYTWEAVGLTVTRTTEAGFPTTSLHVTGNASTYYGGFVGAYIYNPLNTLPETYKSLTMLIDNSNGKVGDKVEIQLQDKDGDVFSFTQVLITADWKWYTLVLDNFKREDSSATSANRVLDLADLSYVGYGFISASENGVIDIKLDEIALSTVPTSDDTDGDGLPDWWEAKYDLDPNVANINPSKDLTDTDGDGLTDLEEYLRGTDPTVKNAFPEIDNFEGNTINWTVDGSLVASTANTTDINVSWNYDNSLFLEGTANGEYYVGGIQKDILSEVVAWDSSYKMLNILVKSNGQVGDKLVAKLILEDGSVWAFTQYIGDLDKWTYYGMLLDRFELVSGDNQTQDFSQTQFIRLELISRTATGSVSMYVDNINVSTSDVSYDTDGDGLPDWYETSHDLKINVPNTGDIDGDGWSDLDEYAAETDANQWTPHFPLIDNFERVGYTWEADGLTVTRTTEAGFPTTSLHVTGNASKYYGGFVGAYIYNPLNTLPEIYKSLTMLIDNSNGKVGDKVEIQLQDKDGDVFSFTQVLITADWKWYTLVLDNFTQVSGNGVLNLADLSYVGYGFISATATGAINIKLDEIALSTVPTSDDTDGDGLPDWWEAKYDLDPNVANINPSKDLTDTDGDGFTDLEEYLMNTDPNQGNVRNVLKGWNFFSVVNEGGQNIRDIVTYLEAQLGAGSIEEAAIWSTKNGEFSYMTHVNFPVAYGQSYYIKSNVRKAITPSVTVTMPQSYSFTTGWNLLGKPAGKAYKASELLAEINDRDHNGKVDAKDLPLRAIAIKVYDNFYYNGWLHYRADNTGTDFIVGATYKSYGFMIQLTEDFVWTPKKDL